MKLNKSFVDKLGKDAVPKNVGRLDPDRPQLVDPTKAPDQFGIPKKHFDELLNNTMENLCKPSKKISSFKMISNENERINNNSNGEIPDGNALSFVITKVNPSLCLSRIKKVIRLIALYDTNNWPTDDIWKNFLPSWFVAKVRSYTIEDQNRSLNLWHFVSCLVAMMNRGWRWFSSKTATDEFIVILEALEFPYSVNLLEF